MAARAGRSVHQSPTCFPVRMRSSKSGQRLLPWVLAPVIGLALAGGWIDLKRTEETQRTAAEAFWQAGKPVAIAVKGGHRRELCARQVAPGSEILVIVSALSRDRGPFSVEISAKPATGAAIPALTDIESGRDRRLDRAALRPRQAFDGMGRRLDCAKEPAAPGGFASAKERRVSHAGARRRRLQPEQLSGGSEAVLLGGGPAHSGVRGIPGSRFGAIRGSARHHPDFRRPGFSLDFEPIRTCPGCRRRRAVHRPAFELARTPGRRPVRGRRLCQGRRYGQGVPAPLEINAT